MKPNPVVTREDWLAARKSLLAEEKALTRAKDEVAKKRRALPWIKMDKAYVFESSSGPKSLADLFGRRSQLFVYHFMLSPDNDHICPGCSFICDHVDSARMHFEHNDLSFAAVARAKVPWIETVKKRMGWNFQWVSSFGNSFNYDFHVSFTPEQLKGEVEYNFTPFLTRGAEQPGFSLFYKDEAGTIFHTYSAYARACDILLNAYNFLDFAPKGRNEASTMDWVRLHDEYKDSQPVHCCGADTKSH